MLQKIIIIIIICIVSNLGTTEYSTQNNSSEKESILFDNAVVSVGIDSLDLTSEWVSREVFYDGYMTEEIEYRKRDYPGSYLAIRYSYSNIIRVYFSADNLDTAVPMSVYGLTWGSDSDKIIKTLGKPTDDSMQEDSRILCYKDVQKNMSISLFINNKGLYAVDIWKI